MTRDGRCNLFLLLPFLLLSPASSHAASFYIQEQSVSGLGTAYAGAVADTPDVSTVYYNPAGMTELALHPQLYIGVHVISPSAYTRDSGSSVNSGAATGNSFVSLQGDNGGNPFDPEFIPNLFFAAPLTPDLWAGLAVTAPFGLANEYGKNFFGRYNSTENNLKTIDVAPSLAWRATSWLSIGGGIDAQYADATLKNAIPSPATAGGPTVATDGVTHLSGDDFTVGFNAGILVKPTESTKIGLHYRQGISHTLKGHVTNTLPSDIPVVGGNVVRVTGQAGLNLPDIVSFGVSQRIDDRWTVLGSANWYKWSNFEDIPVVTPAGSSSTPQNYRNTLGIAVGTRYRATDSLTLKAGFQYDPTPTVDNARSTRIPDGDRLWITGGIDYKLTDDISLDVSGAYIDVSRERINLTETNSVTNVVTRTRGTTKGSVGILSAGLSFQF